MKHRKGSYSDKLKETAIKLRNQGFSYKDTRHELQVRFSGEIKKENLPTDSNIAFWVESSRKQRKTPEQQRKAPDTVKVFHATSLTPQQVQEVEDLVRVEVRKVLRSIV